MAEDYVTVREIKDVLMRARSAMGEAVSLCSRISRDAVLCSQLGAGMDGPTCPRPMTGPLPGVHPGSARCWKDLPIHMGDMMDALHEMDLTYGAMQEALRFADDGIRLPFSNEDR